MDAISAGGTMLAASPPPAEDVHTLTPLPDLHSPSPVVGGQFRLPPPLPKPPRPSVAAMDSISDATVIDLHAQLKASTDAQATVLGRPLAAKTTAAPSKTMPVGKVAKDEGKKG
jgi:hypothetical protein